MPAHSANQTARQGHFFRQNLHLSGVQVIQCGYANLIPQTPNRRHKFLGACGIYVLWADRQKYIPAQPSRRAPMCDHTHTVLAITGGFTFDPQSGPEDDIREQVYCLDCGQTVPDAQQTADKPQTEIELTFSF